MGCTFIARCIAVIFVICSVTLAEAQGTADPRAQSSATSTAATLNPAAKPPDMVCFGNGPRWSIQFVAWGARYLGINEPDQDFLGGFNWVPDQKVWVWQRQNGLAPTSGYALSATISKKACTDSTLQETFPFSAQVNMPTGDIVNGCCRKLKPGEAPVGPHGVPSNNTPPQ